jgi:hypothetical protein
MQLFKILENNEIESTENQNKPNFLKDAKVIPHQETEVLNTELKKKHQDNTKSCEGNFNLNETSSEDLHNKR